MPNFIYVKDPVTQKSKVVQIADVSNVEPVQVTQPNTATLPGLQQRFQCKVEGCGKKFATQGVFSIHYNRNHRVGESKDEWRTYVEKVAE